MVKGIRPLNLELSWVYVIFTYSSNVLWFTFVPFSPFKYGNKIPTNEEVSRSSENILDDPITLTCHHPRERDEVRKLMNDLTSLIPSEPVSSVVFVECTHPEDFVVAAILYNDSIRPHQLVLTRDERHRISRTGADLFGSPMPDLLQPAGPGGGDITTGADCRQYEGWEGDDEEFVPVPAKRRRLGDFSPVADSLLEYSLESPVPAMVHHAILPPITELASPERAETLNDGCPPAPPNVYIPPDTTSQPRGPGRQDLPNTAHHSVPDQTTELGHMPTTGSRRDFAKFLVLRGVRPDVPPVVTTAGTVIDNPPVETLPILQPPVTDIPPDLIDKNTIQLPEPDSLPVSRHQYLASLDLLQKHALCRRLSDDSAAIDLIEREFLGGVDLILDQDTAILFLSLSVVPSECEGLIAGISDISWRYSHILVIFEAFLVSQAFGDGEVNRMVSFSFTEPILKSVKKLKRSLAIADGVGTKAEDCLVRWAFAKNIEEAARLARIYGDMAESRDETGGLLWQERWWLGERDAEDSPLFEFEVRLAGLF